jgi:hypothetical protein
MYVVFALVVLSVLLYSIFWSDRRRIRVEPPQDTENFCCRGSTNVGTVHFVKGSEFEGHATRPAESRVQLAIKEEEMVMRIIGIAVLVC